jgi:uncharacterized protein (TIGR03086 family)
MDIDLLDLYGRASEWTVSKIPKAAENLDAPSVCDGWDVRTLLNHILETQRYFTSSAQGKEASPPSADPPELLASDPAAQFADTREETLRVFGEDGVIEKTGPALGIAFSDMLLHGWDVAKSSGQDATMPDGLPETAYSMIHGKFTEEQRKGIFDPEIPGYDDAPPQDKLLAYTGRDPKT